MLAQKSPDIIRLLAPGRSLGDRCKFLDHRPDLKLDGFRCKRTSLLDPAVRTRLATADSMAWPSVARFEGRDQNAWDEAGRFALEIGGSPEAIDHLAARAGWRRAVPSGAAAPQRGQGPALWLQ